MKAMILAAGIGTRLRPLTNMKPKALVEIGGKPMLQILIEKMKLQGFNQIVVNVHHFGEQIIDFLKENKNFDIQIQVSDERLQLLDTGGGLKKAREFLDSDEAFILHNVDIFSDIHLGDLMRTHFGNPALATLSVMDGKSSRRLHFDEKQNLCAWENIDTGELKIARSPDGQMKSKTFTGIHVIDPLIFKYIKEKGAFSIIDLYLRLAETHKIKGYTPPMNYWFDLGKIEDLKKAESYL
jgi:NDP-sugar pyrophosphorylase family protein